MGIPDLQTAECEDAGMQKVYRGGDLNLLSFAQSLIDPRENTNENLLSSNSGTCGARQSSHSLVRGPAFLGLTRVA
jgi:hypothetical protein